MSEFPIVHCKVIPLDELIEKLKYNGFHEDGFGGYDHISYTFSFPKEMIDLASAGISFYATLNGCAYEQGWKAYTCISEDSLNWFSWPEWALEVSAVSNVSIPKFCPECGNTLEAYTNTIKCPECGGTFKVLNQTHA